MMHAGPQAAGMHAGALSCSYERAKRSQPDCHNREMGRKTSHEDFRMLSGLWVRGVIKASRIRVPCEKRRERPERMSLDTEAPT